MLDVFKGTLEKAREDAENESYTFTDEISRKKVPRPFYSDSDTEEDNIDGYKNNTQPTTSQCLHSRVLVTNKTDGKY